MKYQRQKQQGFGLIEILIVIAIIAILAGIVVATFGSSTFEARNASRARGLDSFAEAIQQYFIDNEAYPDDLDNLVNASYISDLPSDPLTKNPYSYVICVVNSKFRMVLGAELENAKGAVDKADSDFGLSDWLCADNPDPVCIPADGSGTPEICPGAGGGQVDCSGNLIYCVSR